MPAVVYTQSWTGTDNADWPSGWTFMSGDTSGTTSRFINSNRGAQSVTGSGSFRNDMLTGLGDVANFEIVVKINPGDTSGNGTNPAFFFRASSSNAILTGVYLDILFLAPNTGRLRLMRAPAYAGLQDHLFTYATTKEYYLKVRGNGTSVQARIWATDATEPSTWGISFTETTHTTGRFGFTHYGANAAARTVYWDDLQITNLDTQVLEPSGIASDQGLGLPEVGTSGGNQNVSPSSIASGQAFGTVSIGKGPVSVALTSVTSGEAFGTPVVMMGSILVPTGIGSAQSIGTASVSTTVLAWPSYGNAYAGPGFTITPGGIAPVSAFGAVTVYTGTPSAQTVTPTGIPLFPGELYGSPTVILTVVSPPPPPPPPPAPPAPPVPIPVAYLPMPAAREVLLEVRAPDLSRVGMIDLRDLVDFRVVLRHQNVGSWTLRLQPDHPMAGWLSSPQSGIIATLDGEVLFSGPVDGGNNYRSREVVNGRMVFTGVDDSYMLGDALAYPQPSNPDASTQSVAYDVRSGPAETVMHAYVNANIGPGAPTARRISNLTMASNSARGQNVTHSARFEILGEVLTTLGKLAGLGFRVRQIGSVRTFEVYQPRDLTAAVRFDVFNDTLISHEYGWGVHKVSRAIVAGGGEGAARVFVERSSTDSVAAETLWGRRIERFIDQRQTEDLAELQQAGDEALVEDGKTRTGLEIQPVDTYQVQFARDYFLGDKVTVTVDQIEIQDTITEVEIIMNKDGINAKPVLGQLDTISRHAQLRMLSAQGEQARRLSGLERKV